MCGFVYFLTISVALLVLVFFRCWCSCCCNLILKPNFFLSWKRFGKSRLTMIAHTTSVLYYVYSAEEKQNIYEWKLSITFNTVTDDDDFDGRLVSKAWSTNLFTTSWSHFCFSRVFCWNRSAYTQIVPIIYSVIIFVSIYSFCSLWFAENII